MEPLTEAQRSSTANVAIRNGPSAESAARGRGPQSSLLLLVHAVEKNYRSAQYLFKEAMPTRCDIQRCRDTLDVGSTEPHVERVLIGEGSRRR